MKSSTEISSATKPMFDRLSDSLKVAGAGNGAGLFVMVAAMNTISVEHPHAVLLLKPTALIFALGVALFGVAYLFLTYAYIYSEHYGALLEQAGRGETMKYPPDGAAKASMSYMQRTMICGLASAFVFFVGFVIACTALVRY